MIAKSPPPPHPETHSATRHRPGRAQSWRRFRRLLALTALVGVVAAGAAVAWVAGQGDTSIHLMLALGGGIFLSLLLGGALMGLIFLSNRSGHDDETATGFDADDRF